MLWHKGMPRTAYGLLLPSDGLPTQEPRNKRQEGPPLRGGESLTTEEETPMVKEHGAIRERTASETQEAFRLLQEQTSKIFHFDR
jgi:hypothetical protein